MQIKDFVELLDVIIEGDLETLANDRTLYDKFSEATDQLKKYSDLAVNVTGKGISEKDFVKFMLIVEKVCTTLMVLEDDVDKMGAFMLLQAAGRGALQTYTHSVVMAVIGALYDEGVL